jgi:hypothetical protein
MMKFVCKLFHTKYRSVYEVKYNKSIPTKTIYWCNKCNNWYTYKTKKKRREEE